MRKERSKTKSDEGRYWIIEVVGKDPEVVTRVRITMAELGTIPNS